MEYDAEYMQEYGDNLNAFLVSAFPLLFYNIDRILRFACSPLSQFVMIPHRDRHNTGPLRKSADIPASRLCRNAGK